MEYLWYALSGIAGGVLGGMGMGGGTVLIPLLNIFCGVEQHAAQAVNLVSFIPMAVVALVIHSKNGLVGYKGVLFIIIPGLITCAAGCFLAKGIDGKILSRCFGGFLTALSIFQLAAGLKQTKNDK